MEALLEETSNSKWESLLSACSQKNILHNTPIRHSLIFDLIILSNISLP